MRLENLNLIHFKNFEKATITLNKSLNIILGDNGSGKTNLLDAIYLLSLTKSSRSTHESQNILHGKPFFTVQGTFIKNEKPTLVQGTYQRGKKKIFKAGKNEYEKLSEHIGLFPVVMIAPDDTEMIQGGSELRRKFFDGIIAQMDGVFLDHLLQYSHLLRQRNSLLRGHEGRRSPDASLLNTYDEQLLPLSLSISSKRNEFLQAYLPHFKVNYEALAEGKELVSIKFDTEVLDDDFQSRFKANRDRDLMLQRTELGAHRDDFIFESDRFPVKKFGSQGQQKSFLIALKLSMFDQIKEQKGSPPILLLDDIFDKLDDHRILQIKSLVNSGRFGQIFITDARPERSRRIFESGFEILVKDGKIVSGD